jgi:holo-[acyl-carrier protein] synthase
MFEFSDDDAPPYVGIDLTEVSRVRFAVDRWGDRFLDRVYTKGEQSYCAGRYPQLAARFAAKEAVAKVLGTGMQGIGWLDVEVMSNPAGRPIVRLHGRAIERATDLGIRRVSLSLSHSGDLAIAIAVAIESSRHRAD